ncbi:MAG: hypothetical protein HYV97_18410 [Bdellovibrio sp.]|nr:hypothetical protein [Bdellovibrio sp.]
MHRKISVRILVVVLGLVLSILTPVKAELVCGSGTGVSNQSSLRDPGKSLESMELQDQDGLGTCYANALSLAMEAELGTPVSYHEIALRYGVSNASASGGRSRAVTTTNNDTGEATLFNEGGWSCESFDILRKRRPPTICRRDDIPLERLENSNDQEDVMKKLAEFYDTFSKFKKQKKEKAEKFDEALKEILANANATSSTRCQSLMTDPNRKAIGMQLHLQNYCLEKYTDLQNAMKEVADFTLLRNDLPDNQENKATRDIYLELINSSTEKAGQARAKIRQLGAIDVDPTLTGTVPDMIEVNGESVMQFPSCDLLPKFENILKAHVTHVATAFNNAGELNPAGRMRPVVDQFARANFNAIAGEPNFPAEIFSNSEGSPFSENRLQASLRQDIAQSVPSVCQREIVWRDMQNTETLQNTFYHKAKICLPDDLLFSTVSAFEGLATLNNGAFPAQDFLKAVTKVDGKLDDFMMGIIGPNCAEHAIAIPPALRCDSKDFPITLTSAERRGKNAAKRKELERQKSISFMRNYTETSLNTAPKGRPVMVSLCTAFFQNETHDSDFNRANCSGGIPGHGYHEMSVIGTRCNNGKLEYQVQNSWGQGCGSFTKVTDTDSIVLYDCNEQGGFAWIPEEVLVLNTDKVKRLQ